MNLKKLFCPQFWRYDYRKFRELYDYDLKFNASFRGKPKLSRHDKKRYEIRYLYLYRRCQVANGTIWYYLFFPSLKRFSLKSGIGIYENMHFGKGLIIGHAGTIIINSQATFKGNVFMTHGVTVGRDVRGKRKGAPVIGENVCIRCNSTVVGKITIGDDVLIAPNTFVNFDVPSHSIVIGNPATVHHRDWATEGHLGLIDKKY
mgnify:CR=1 FL=1